MGEFRTTGKINNMVKCENCGKNDQAWVSYIVPPHYRCMYCGHCRKCGKKITENGWKLKGEN